MGYGDKGTTTLIVIRCRDTIYNVTKHPKYTQFFILMLKLPKQLFSIIFIDHASRVIAVPQRPGKIDMKLFQPNMGLNYHLKYEKIFVITGANL